MVRTNSVAWTELPGFKCWDVNPLGFDVIELPGRKSILFVVLLPSTVKFVIVHIAPCVVSVQRNLSRSLSLPTTHTWVDIALRTPTELVICARNAGAYTFRFDLRLSTQEGALQRLVVRSGGNLVTPTAVTRTQGHDSKLVFCVDDDNFTGVVDEEGRLYGGGKILEGQTAEDGPIDTVRFVNPSRVSALGENMLVVDGPCVRMGTSCLPGARLLQAMGDALVASGFRLSPGKPVDPSLSSVCIQRLVEVQDFLLKNCTHDHLVDRFSEAVASKAHLGFNSITRRSLADLISGLKVLSTSIGLSGCTFELNIRALLTDSNEHAHAIIRSLVTGGVPTPLFSQKLYYHVWLTLVSRMVYCGYHAYTSSNTDYQSVELRRVKGTLILRDVDRPRGWASAGKSKKRKLTTRQHTLQLGALAELRALPTATPRGKTCKVMPGTLMPGLYRAARASVPVRAPASSAS